MRVLEALKTRYSPPLLCVKTGGLGLEIIMFCSPFSINNLINSNSIIWRLIRPGGGSHDSHS
jgi:hypothetical protein